jgi:hypothetical protein
MAGDLDRLAALLGGILELIKGALVAVMRKLS